MPDPAWWETTKDLAIGVYLRIPAEERGRHFADIPMERSPIFLRLLAHWLAEGIDRTEALERAAQGWQGMYITYLRLSTGLRD